MPDMKMSACDVNERFSMTRRDVKCGFYWGEW